HIEPPSVDVCLVDPICSYVTDQRLHFGVCYIEPGHRSQSAAGPVVGFGSHAKRKFISHKPSRVRGIRSFFQDILERWKRVTHMRKDAVEEEPHAPRMQAA